MRARGGSAAQSAGGPAGLISSREKTKNHHQSQPVRCAASAAERTRGATRASGMHSYLKRPATSFKSPAEHRRTVDVVKNYRACSPPPTPALLGFNQKTQNRRNKRCGALQPRMAPGGAVLPSPNIPFSCTMYMHLASAQQSMPSTMFGWRSSFMKVSSRCTCGATGVRRQLLESVWLLFWDIPGKLSVTERSEGPDLRDNLCDLTPVVALHGNCAAASGKRIRSKAWLPHTRARRPIRRHASQTNGSFREPSVGLRIRPVPTSPSGLVALTTKDWRPRYSTLSSCGRDERERPDKLRLELERRAQGH